MNALVWVIVAALAVAVVVLFLRSSGSAVAPGVTLNAQGDPAQGVPGPRQDPNLGAAIGNAVASAFALANSIFSSQKAA